MTGAPAVAFFLPGLHPGGAEKVILGIASAFAELGLKCEIVCAQSGTPWVDRVPSNVTLVELGSSKPLRAVPKLWMYLRSRRPEVLLSTVTSANIAALVACALPGGRTRCFVREANFVEADLAGGRLGRRVTTLALRILYPRASGIIALSPGMASHLSEYLGISPDRVAVIANPAPVATPTDARSERKPIASPAAIVACGRLVPQKDYSTLLKAVAVVKRQVDCRLRLFGTGPLRDRLQEEAEALGIGPLVTFEGLCDDIVAEMRASDVFVLSSRWEGFPNVLTEALAASTPIVATDCSDAVHEILDDGRLGSIVPVGDHTAMASAIVDIIEGRVTSPPAGGHLARFALGSIALKYRQLLFPGS